MKSNGTLAVMALLLAVLLFTSHATAQEQPTISDCTQDVSCVSLKQQAAERSKNGDAIEALRLYKLAYEVRPDPRLLFNIARLLHKQGKSAEAAEHYRKFIDAPIAEEEQKQKAREYLEQIESGIVPQSKPVAASADQVPKPVYKKWWFWTLVGGAAAAVVVGTAIGVSARQPDLSGVMQYRLMP